MSLIALDKSLQASAAEPGRGRSDVAVANESGIPLRYVCLVSVLLFAVLALFQTLAELEGADSTIGFWSHFADVATFYPPWIVFSVVLYSQLERIADRLTRPSVAIGCFVAATLFYFLPYLLFEVTVFVIREGGPLNSVVNRLINWPTFGYFVDYILFCGCFSSIYGLALVRGQIERDRRNQRLQEQMLTLRLQLEHQRLAAIQAQLEPHFLFNALNAISGLVRSDDKRNALSAIARLSELLRYTVGASRRDWVSLAEEMEFIGDYLDLQRLRHGDRLRVHIEANQDALRDVDCPPLLLQPLVENALRHDLEAHQGPSDIRLRIEMQPDGVRIFLSNPVSPNAAPNPGLGLGLSNTRDRLALRYGEGASLRSGIQAGRFEVELLLPDVERA